MSYDLNMFIRNQLRQAAAVHIEELAATVANEIAGHSEETDDYIPEVETGGARYFGDTPIISPEQQADEEVWLGILNDFVQGQLALRRPQGQGPEADQDHGDTQPADVAGARCNCQRRFTRKYCAVSPCPNAHIPGCVCVACR